MARRVKAGDIFCVPLKEDLVAVGIVLHVSQEFEGDVIAGFYRQAFASVDEVDIAAVGGQFIETPNHAERRFIGRGDWPVIGNSPKLLAKASIPHLRAAYSLYYKDAFVRLLKPEELRDYPELLRRNGEAVKIILRRHFCPPPPDEAQQPARWVAEGHLFGVPLDEHRLAVGIVLHAPHLIPDSFLVGFYRRTFPSVTAVSSETLRGSLIDPPHYIRKDVLTHGDWPLLGYHPELLGQLPVPPLRTGHALWDKDQLVRLLEPREFGQYAERRWFSREEVEERLRGHVGRQP